MKRTQKVNLFVIALAAFAALLAPTLFAVNWQPGLRVGTVSGQANWKDWPAVTNVTLRLDATEIAENKSAYSFWSENVTYVYWGQMYFQEGVYHFAESMDDSAYMSIDGNVVLKDTNWGSCSYSGDVTMTEGWHDVVFRFGNGSGGAGPYTSSNWTATKGFGYNIGGENSINGNAYELLFDSGDGSFFRYAPDFPTLGEISATTEESGDAATLAANVATFEGTNAVTMTFFYGKTDGGEDKTAWEVSVVVTDVLAAGAQTVTVEGLDPDTAYCFRVFIENEFGSAWSASAATFRTFGLPELGEATLVASAPTSAQFAYALSNDVFAWMGVEVREQLGGGGMPSGTSYLPKGVYTNVVDGLAPGATYEWNVVASNVCGVVRSEAQSFTTPTEATVRTSASGGLWSDAATWNPAGVPAYGDIVTIAAGHVVTNASETACVGSLTVEEGAEIFVEGWDSAIRAAGAVTVAGTLRHATNEVLTAEADGSWATIARVRVDCGSFTLTETGLVDGKGRGYPGARSSANGDSSDVNKTSGRGPGGGSYCGTGGTHGGTGGYFRANGGAIFADQRKSVYDSATEPTQPGSGGNKCDNYDAGCGGGVVRIEATGDVTVDGTIDVDGTMMGSGNHLSGGAGGSVFVSCRRILGSGTVRANGGDGVYYSCGGGGGRIAVAYDPEAQSAADLPGVRFLALGGSASWEGGRGGDNGKSVFYGLFFRRPYNVEAGGLGTLWFPDSQFLTRSLASGRFRHGGVWMAAGAPADVSVAGDLTIDGGALAFPTAVSLAVSGNLVIRGINERTRGEMLIPSSRLSLTNGSLTVGGLFAATNAIVELANSPLTVRGDVDFKRVRGVAGSDGEYRPKWIVNGSARLSDKTAIAIESGADGDAPTSLAEIPRSGGAMFSVGGALVMEKSYVWPASNVENGGSPWVRVGSLSLDKDSAFNADLLGYEGIFSDNGPGNGPGAGSGGSTTTCSGGGYGGCGANSNTVNGVLYGGTYGSAYAPYQPGSSGGSGQLYSQNAGGSVRILCDGTATVNGLLTASCAGYGVRWENWGSGASGGGVWVICREFVGSAGAAIKADGGQGRNPNFIAGGGGRVAVWLLPKSTASASAVRGLLAERSGANYEIAQPASWAGTASAAAGDKAGEAATYQKTDAEAGTVVWLSIPPPGGFTIRIR